MDGMRYIGLGDGLTLLGMLVLFVIGGPIILMIILTELYFQDWGQMTELVIVSALTISLMMVGIGQVLCVYGRFKVSE